MATHDTATRQGVRHLAAALLLAALAAACGGPRMEGELLYRAEALGGGPPARADLDAAAMRLDRRLLEEKLTQRDVSAIPPDRIRVVLPESAAGRVDALRARLEDPEGLPVRLTLLRQGSD